MAMFFKSPVSMNRRNDTNTYTAVQMPKFISGYLAKSQRIANGSAIGLHTGHAAGACYEMYNAQSCSSSSHE